MPAFAQWTRSGDLRIPAHHVVGEGTEQEITKVATDDLGPTAIAVIGFGQVDHGLVVEDAHGLAAGVYQRTEAVVETGRPQRFLAGVLMDVEHAALRPGGRRRVEIEYCRIDAVHM